MKLRLALLAGVGFAGCVAGQELPKFEVDTAKWRAAMGMTKPVLGERVVSVEKPRVRCAVRLREFPVSEGARVRVVEPEKGRVFSYREAEVPAEACGKE